MVSSSVELSVFAADFENCWCMRCSKRTHDTKVTEMAKKKSPSYEIVRIINIGPKARKMTANLIGRIAGGTNTNSSVLILKPSGPLKP